MDEGGSIPCPDQDHHKSCPWSNQPQEVEDECHMWIRFVQGELSLHEGHLDHA